MRMVEGVTDLFERSDCCARARDCFVKPVCERPTRKEATYLDRSARFTPAVEHCIDVRMAKAADLLGSAKKVGDEVGRIGDAPVKDRGSLPQRPKRALVGAVNE